MNLRQRKSGQSDQYSSRQKEQQAEVTVKGLASGPTVASAGTHDLPRLRTRSDRQTPKVTLASTVSRAMSTSRPGADLPLTRYSCSSGSYRLNPFQRTPANLRAQLERHFNAEPL